ncbi:MAG: mercury(II) reductase [Nitrospinota bacterium]
MARNNSYAGKNSGGNKEFDLAVIGAGSAGFSAAIKGSELGARVALVGYGTIGGTCVNIGCVPSKNLIRAAETIHHAEAASRFTGIGGKVKVGDWRKVIDQKNRLVRELRKTKYADLLSEYDSITYIEGKARLVDGGIDVNGSVIKAKKVIITTGASPALPPIRGIEDVPYLTSTTALDLEKLPESLLVIGGGYIGCEFAQMLARFATKVTVACRSRLLPQAEPEISKALTEYFRDEGITVRDGLSYRAIRKTGEGNIVLEIEAGGNEETIEAQQVLITTGRKPNIEGLGLEEMGVELTKNGGIKVDDFMGSANANVYAAGDVTDRDQFVYMAAYGAKIAAENALNGENIGYDATTMPSIVFTDPQVASVGLTEKDARLQDFDVITSILPLEYVPRALAARDTRGLIKLVADAKSNRLLGAHILAPEGADSIQTAALAIKHGVTTAELAETIFPYLTTVEGLKLAAQAFKKNVSKLSCCAG